MKSLFPGRGAGIKIKTSKTQSRQDFIMIGQKLFGASSNLYGGTIYGKAVEGEKCKQVRVFSVTGETSRSWILDGQFKIGKKSMAFNTGSFVIAFFKTHKEAIASLSH